MSAIVAEGVWKFYGDYPALRDMSFTVGPGRVPGPARPQRRRQDHAAADPGRAFARPPRAASRSSASRRATARPAAPSASSGTASRVYDELSAFENLRLFGELYGLPDPRKAAAANGWSAPAWSASATAWCASSRAACGSGWPWRAPSCTSRACCCWTSRSPRSTTAPSRCCKRLLRAGARRRPHHRHVHPPVARSARAGHRTSR